MPAESAPKSSVLFGTKQGEERWRGTLTVSTQGASPTLHTFPGVEVRALAHGKGGVPLGGTLASPSSASLLLLCPDMREHQGQRLRTHNSALPALRGGGTQAWKRAVECQSLRSEASRRPSNSTRQIAAPASCKAASVWLKDLTNWSRHSYGIRKSGIPTTFS